MKKITLVIVLLPLMWYFFLKMTGVYFNMYSNSMPYGLYRKVNKTPQKGDVAATCLNARLAQFGLIRGYLDHGPCDTGIMPIVKRIVGVEGDEIKVNNDIIMINGVKFSEYQVMGHDSRGRAVNRYYNVPYKLKSSEFWLMSNYKGSSWDSRYWGAVNVEFVLEPLFIFGDT